ncbi:MAG: DUF4390 domain-containing protein [bacterium]
MFSGRAWASKAEIREFTLSNKHDYVYVGAKLEGAFTEGIREAITSGIPTTFKYYLELVAPRHLWFDRKTNRKVLQYRVAYDTLKKEYEVTIDDGASSQVRVTKSEEEMRRWMTTIDSYRFLDSRKIQPVTRYKVRLKAEMKCIKMPFPLNFLLFYISFWDFDTPWVSSPIPRASHE